MSIPRHETPPRFELGSLDSKSSVLTVTLRGLIEDPPRFELGTYRSAIDCSTSELWIPR